MSDKVKPELLDDYDWQGVRIRVWKFSNGDFRVQGDVGDAHAVYIVTAREYKQLPLGSWADVIDRVADATIHAHA